MSERSSEFRDSDVVRNEPLASDIEREKKDGCFKSKLFKIIKKKTKINLNLRQYQPLIMLTKHQIASYYSKKNY